MLTLNTQSLTETTKIRIAGAGIAGMTAAINLKHFGLDVKVYEKGSVVGSNRHGDFEGLENWIFDRSIADFFVDHGFDPNQIDHLPIHEFTVHVKNEPPLNVQSVTPFFYMIQRGKEQNSFDTQLFHQCKKAGVEFEFESSAPDNVDIDSTGSKRAAAHIKGVNFFSTLPNQVHLLLGHEFAPKGYAYLIIINGKGTLATAFKKNDRLSDDPLESAIQYFHSIGMEIPTSSVFGSRGSFSIMNMQFSDRPIKIGEAGGYQDFLFGFGMRLAMASGLAAACQLSGHIKRSKKIVKDLNRKRNVSYVNRVLYERLQDEQMASLAKRFSSTDDPLSILSRAYQWNFKNIRRWIRTKKNLEVRTA